MKYDIIGRRFHSFMGYDRTPTDILPSQRSTTAFHASQWGTNLAVPVVLVLSIGRWPCRCKLSPYDPVKRRARKKKRYQGSANEAQLGKNRTHTRVYSASILTPPRLFAKMRTLKTCTRKRDPNHPTRFFFARNLFRLPNIAMGDTTDNPTPGFIIREVA